MIAYQLFRASSRYLQLFSETKYLPTAIFTLAGYWKKLVSLTVPAIVATQDQNRLLQLSKGAREVVDEAINHIRDLSPSLLFLDARALPGSVEELLKAFEAPPGMPLAVIPQQIREFERLYEKTIKQYSQDDALRLMECAFNLQQRIDATKEMAQFLSARLLARTPAPDGYDDLFLYFGSSGSTNDLVRKLQALNGLYEVLCRVLQVSTQEHPFQVIRLEIGTLFFLGRGAKAVVDLMGDLMKSAIGFLHRRYTSEGRIDSLPRKVDAVESVLKLRDKLKKRGIETSIVDNDLRESAVIIATELNSLLRAEFFVEIQGETFDLPAQVREKLTAVERNLLEDRRSDNDDSEDSGSES